MKEKYFKYVKNHYKNSFENKTCFLIGGTGGTGKALATYMSFLKINLILAARNLDEAEKIKNELTNKYHNKIEIIKFDFLNDEILKQAYLKIKDRKIDFFFNDAGIYHQKIKYIDGKEITNLVNFIRPIQFITKLSRLNNYKETRFINVASISYKFVKSQTDISKKSSKIKTLHYALSKRMLVLSSLMLKKEGVNIVLAHPGISTTNLFSKKNNAFPKIFYILIVPLMKLVFMNQEKAALSLLNAINDDYNLNEWSGPRGFLHCWGYPNKQKFDKKIIKDLNNPQIIKFIENEVK